VRRRIAALLRSEDGALPTIELIVLAFPLLILTLALIQQARVAQAVVATEHAAYAAARSALVHSCRPIPALGGETSVIGAVKSFWGSGGCAEPRTTDGSTPWDVAARMALIPISPSREGAGACAYPDAAIDMAERGPVGASLADALHHKACYAFAPANVRVELEFLSAFGPISGVKTMPPIRATVTYRMPVYGPVRGLFADGTRGDASHYRVVRARVDLL
jgi:hypothetical protein